MRFKKTLLLAMAALAVGPAFSQSDSQSDDFGIWTSVGADKQLTKKLSVGGGLEFRSGDNLQEASRWSGSLGMDYKLNRFLKLGVGYVFISDYNPLSSKVNYTPKGKVNGYNVDHSFWQSKHRVFAEATGSVKMGRFKLSLRERYQYTTSVATNCDRTRYRGEVKGGDLEGTFPWAGSHFLEKTEGKDHKSAKDKHYLRTRAKVEYNIPKCPLNPFVSYELSNDLEDGMDLDKTRLIVGTEWKISKQHTLSLGYLYQTGTDGQHEGANHVLDIGYNFKF